MEHKYSTYTLIGIITIIIGAYAIAELDTSDLDEICNKEGDMITRYNNQWVCSSDVTLTEDLRFPIEQIGVRGVTNKPDYEIFMNNTQALAFDDTTMEQAFITMQLPHGRVENSTLKAHWHWASNGQSPNGNVVWCLEISCANINEVFGDTIIRCVTDEAGLQYKHMITEQINLTNTLDISSVCLIRIYRDATNGNDNMSGDASLFEFDLHYKAKNVGEVY